MKNKRPVSILLRKSYALCLTIVLVGCVPVATASPTPISTPTFTQNVVDISTKTSSLPLSGDVPVETSQSNKSEKGFFEDQRMIVTNPGENIEAVLNEAGQDGILLESCDLSFPNTVHFDSFSAKIEEGIFATHELRNDRFLYTDPYYPTSPVQNSKPCSLPNSGGGSGGGRRMIKQETL